MLRTKLKGCLKYLSYPNVKHLINTQSCISLRKEILVTSKRFNHSGIKLTQSYEHCVSDKKLVGKTMGAILDDASELYPENEACVYFRDNKRLTYYQLNEQANQLAAGLLALGLKKGDRVGIWGQNHLEWILTLFGAAKAGVILVNVNPAYRSDELEYALNKVDMKAIIMMPTFKTSDYYEILRNVTPEIEFSHAGQLKADRAPSLRHVIMTEGPAKKGTFSFEEVMNLPGGQEQHRVNQLKNEISFDDPVNIQFTSGTTGNPKGATLTHHNLVNNAVMLVDGLGYTQSSRLCIPVPLYHCFGMTIGCLTATIVGSTQLYPSRGFDSGAVLETIHNERATSVYGTPAMFIDVLNHPDFKKFDCTSLVTGVMAGSPCPIEVMNQIINDMHCKEMTIAYGLTETSPATNLCSRDSPVELRTSTVGQLIGHTEIKVIDEEGQIVPINTAGELCYRGHNIFQGYWEDEKKTKEAIDENGWFHTGDLGTLDENGYTRIVGRKKDMVIRGGENIYPTEVENFLYKHPKIEDVQIVGLPDSRMGEELCAWIKIKKGETATVDEIKAFCKGNISHFKIPKYIEFVKEYPMTVTGKVLKVGETDRDVPQEKIKKFEIRKEMIKRFHAEQEGNQ